MEVCRGQMQLRSLYSHVVGRCHFGLFYVTEVTDLEVHRMTHGIRVPGNLIHRDTLMHAEFTRFLTLLYREDNDELL